MKLIVVESPAKAKNISQYVGSEYKVLASYGHVRDLPSKSGSVRPEEDFSMTWTVMEKAQKALSAIESAVEKADTLILATDMDREGEAISWHLYEHLKHKLANIKVQRVAFNAVTRGAVLEALKHPRNIDEKLVHAYLARLGLDYLVGYTLSPVLWRKLPGSRSAGRVQSVALRMVVEREREIQTFETQEYWSIHGCFFKEKSFEAQLTHFHGKKLQKLSISNKETAIAYVEVLQKHAYFIKNAERKQVARHPSAPFITSTLQQEASRKLGFSPARTMQVAQKLYEGVEIEGKTIGLITYMRTDSPFILPDVVTSHRLYIQGTFGPPYLHPSPRKYKSKGKSQEAHEAIRPTEITLLPESLHNVLEVDQKKLYQLIWERTLASQMASALYDQTILTLASREEDHTFRATGSVLTFDGFLKVYEEKTEEEAQEEKNTQLPLLNLEDALVVEKIYPSQHFTQPPPRYSEASLVKTLEDHGIGRPSTYARILQVLQERGYVELDKKRLIPKELGVVVKAFLREFFSKYVDYQFTADLETDLDRVSSGEKAWKQVLQEFWPDFNSAVKAAHELTITHVLQTLEKTVVGEQRSCPKCSTGMLGLRLGKTGPFLSCNTYPECTYTSSLSNEETVDGEIQGALAKDPQTQEDIQKKRGPYGWYLQRGDQRVTIAAPFNPETLSSEDALWLISLPKPLGNHPVTGKPITLGIGRFGVYVKHDNTFASVKDSPQNISLESAVMLLEQRKTPKKGGVGRSGKQGKESIPSNAKKTIASMKEKKMTVPSKKDKDV